MAKRRRPLSQVWKTFLRNRADAVASINLFVASTISLRLLDFLYFGIRGEKFCG